MVGKKNRSGQFYIKAGDAQNSLVHQRIHSSGNPMPPGGQLNASLRQKLTDWICNGAKP